MSLPESIRSAAEGRSRRRLIGVRMRVSRGQIRSIRCSSVGAIPDSDTPERMVLVLRVDTKREFSEVMLVHPYLELATSLDLVVTPEFSTIPYSIVVETDTRAVVWTYQLEHLIGQLDSDALGTVGEVAYGQPLSRKGLCSATPLRGPLEPRWDFKIREGDVIRSMAADCTSTLLADGSHLEELAKCVDIQSRIRMLLNIMQHNKTAFTMDDVVGLESLGLLERSSWTDMFGLSGQDHFDYCWLRLEPALDTLSLPRDLTERQPVGRQMSYP